MKMIDRIKRAWDVLTESSQEADLNDIELQEWLGITGSNQKCKIGRASCRERV